VHPLLGASIKGEKIMGMKYCPKCQEVVVTKALSNYSQVDFKGISGKRRKIVHLEEDGFFTSNLALCSGSSHFWLTYS